MTQIAGQHSDIRVKNTVADELAWTSNVNAAQVGVSVHDGVVRLSGEVDCYPEKTAALAAALRVAGVTSVVDEITVRSRTAHHDADIATHVKHALHTSTSVPHTVRAADVAWDTPGVMKVHNNIHVVP